MVCYHDTRKPPENLFKQKIYTIDAQQQVMKIGEMISKYGPFIFTFTGGNVTNGALEISKLQ